MSDPLRIWGTDYTDVKGFKSKDANNNQYAYVRPQGSKSITANGTGIDVSEYATVNVNVPGGFSYDDMAANNIPSGDIVLTGTRIENFAFAYRNSSHDWTVYGPNVTYIGQNAFRQCYCLKEARFPNLTS